jgi:hypothetical protein
MALIWESQFWLDRPESSVGHSQTLDSLIYILIAPNILRTLVSVLELESKALESSGRGSRQNSPFSLFLAIFGSIYLKEEIISLLYFHACMF